MMKKNKSTKPHPLPETTVIEQAYKSAQYRKNFLEMFRSTTFMLIVVAAFAVLVAILFLPILRIYGKSMKGTLNSGDIVVSVKSGNFETGDVVAFYYNNNILVKRVIAESGDWVDMDEKGNVYVNGKELNEPYLSKKAYGKPILPFLIKYQKIVFLLWGITVKCRLIHEILLSERFQMSKLLDV